MAAVLIGTCSRLRALTQSKRLRSVFLCKWWSPRAHRLSFASEVGVSHVELLGEVVSYLCFLLIPVILVLHYIRERWEQ